MKTIEKIYILGTGNLALHCAFYAREHKREVLLFEMAEKKSMFMETKAKKLEIQYFHEGKEIVFYRLLEETENVLLISAINEYIIPAKVLEKKNITAVNLHQALLPKHPGRNAESWVIFEQEKVTGITWHFMESRVDKGDIIIQKEIALDDDITAYKLFQKQIEAAKEAFNEIFEDLIEGKAYRIPQEKKTGIHFHKSYEIPNNGYLDLSWSGEKRSAFLRAMDYSVLNVMGRPKLYFKDEIYQWKKYEIHKTDSMEEKMIFREKDIYLQKDKIVIILKDYTKQEDK